MVDHLLLLACITLCILTNSPFHNCKLAQLQARLHMMRTDVPIDHDCFSTTYRQLANGSRCSDCSHWLQPYIYGYTTLLVY